MPERQARAHRIATGKGSNLEAEGNSETPPAPDTPRVSRASGCQGEGDGVSSADRTIGPFEQHLCLNLCLYTSVCASFHLSKGSGVYKKKSLKNHRPTIMVLSVVPGPAALHYLEIY